MFFEGNSQIPKQIRELCLFTKLLANKAYLNNELESFEKIRGNDFKIIQLCLNILFLDNALKRKLPENFLFFLLKSYEQQLL